MSSRRQHPYPDAPSWHAIIIGVLYFWQIASAAIFFCGLLFICSISWGMNFWHVPLSQAAWVLLALFALLFMIIETISLSKNGLYTINKYIWIELGKALYVGLFLNLVVMIEVGSSGQDRKHWLVINVIFTLPFYIGLIYAIVAKYFNFEAQPSDGVGRPLLAQDISA